MFPGTLQAYYDAKIYSRVPGYVHAWYQDIGAHVKKASFWPPSTRPNWTSRSPRRAPI